MPTPRVSVFTPSHRPSHLDDAWRSLAAQTVQDFEWIVLLNAGAMWQPPADPRVRVLRADGLTGVGAVKARACELCRGEILVELDHDDELASECLEVVLAAFDAHPEAGLVFSDFAQIAADGGRDDSRFDPGNGWEYHDETVDGRDVLCCESMLPTPHNVSLIWFAPNHVRAFRRRAYDAAGGYAPDRDVLDDQDLMSRLYQQAEFVHIPRCLYLQRMHAENTQRHPELNARIQNETLELYERDIQANAMAWSGRRGLGVVCLGEDPGAPTEMTRVSVGIGDDATADALTGRLPFADASVGLIRAVDALPRFHDKVGLFNELYRVLAHGGMLLSLTPSTDGRGAFVDPCAHSFYNQASFWPFLEQRFADSAPGLTARFQSSRLLSDFPSDWHRQEQLPYVQANLIAIKDGPRQGGYLTI